MMGQSRYRGMSSFDAVFSLVPILLLLVFVMGLSSQFVHHSAEATHRQQVFNKLVSIADYTVKNGAVLRTDDAKYPNWVDENIITSAYTENLRERAGLAALELSLDEPGEGPMCIYRIVVVGEERKITRVFVCGG